MALDIKKNLKLLIPRYGKNDLTTRRITLFAVLIPIIFGGLAVWVSYSKVSYSEKKYNDMFHRLNETRDKLQTLRAKLDSSQASILSSDEKLRAMANEYNFTQKKLSDSLGNQKKNILFLRSEFSGIRKSYEQIQDSNRVQSELLTQNNKLIASSSKELSFINDSLEWMKGSLKKSKDSLLAAKADVVLMKSSLENVTGEVAKIHPQARSRTLFGRKDAQERLLFEFAIWLEVPKDVRKNIVDVTYKYFLNDGQKGSDMQTITISDFRSDYKTTYEAWGCIPNMIIEVRFKNNLSSPLLFDVCKALNNPLIEPMLPTE